jgi:hypothetical protein
MKILNFLFLLLSLSIIVADCGYFDSPYSHHVISPQGKASDVSNCIEHAHSSSFDDNFVLLSTGQKLRLSTTLSNFYPELNLQANSSYTSNIWQPPKMS